MRRDLASAVPVPDVCWLRAVGAARAATSTSRTRSYTAIHDSRDRRLALMRVVALVRQVPDAEAHIRADGGVLDLTGVTHVIDSMDEYGVEEAVRLKEAGHDLEVVALALGPDSYKEALRSAL